LTPAARRGSDVLGRVFDARRSLGRRLSGLLLGPTLAVADQDLVRAADAVPAAYLGQLVLEQLVGLEEVLDLDQAMRTDLLEPLHVGLVRIADRHAQHLEVRALLVSHLEAADGPGPDVASGKVGSSTSSRVSVGSPSSDSVSAAKP